MEFVNAAQLQSHQKIVDVYFDKILRFYNLFFAFLPRGFQILLQNSLLLCPKPVFLVLQCLQ